MPATFTLPLITVISGQTITASLWNNEYENIDTNFIPAGMDDYSATDNEMRTATDPFPASATSRPTSLQGELERLRYVLAQLSGETYWYIDPDTTIAALYARFPVQTADIGDSQVTTAKIADSNVTTAKIADSNITTGKIADDAVTAAKIVAGAVGNSELASDAVTTDKIAAGAVGTADIADAAVTTVKIADSNVTTAKIADSNVTTAKIADSNVTTAKIADSNVTTAKIADSNVTTGKIANAAVDENKLASSVAGNGLAGGAGTALSVNVDGSTLEISSDSLRVKDAGVTEAKLATAVVNKLGQNIGAIQVSSSTNGDIVNFSGQGRLKMVGAEGGSVTSFSITIDGTTTFSGLSLTSSQMGVWQAASPYIVGSATPHSTLDLYFRTSLVVNKAGGAGSLVVIYERSA